MATVATQAERRERLERVINSEAMSLLLAGESDEAERLARSLLGLER
jgi:hypothetical protein